MNRALSVMLVCVVSVPVALAAQDAPLPLAQWGILFGPQIVTGPFTGSFNTGAVFGLLGYVPISQQRLSLRVDATYHWMNDQSNENRYSWTISGSADLIVRTRDRGAAWSPYALGGVAAYGFGDSEGSIQSYHPKHFGFEGGVGVKFRRPHHTTFIEARYQSISPGGVVPIVVGFRY